MGPYLRSSNGSVGSIDRDTDKWVVVDAVERLNEQAATILAMDAEIEQLRNKIKSLHIVPKSQIDQMRKG